MLLLPVSEPVASPLSPGAEGILSRAPSVFDHLCLWDLEWGRAQWAICVFFFFFSFFLDNQLGLPEIPGCVLSTPNWHLPRALPMTEQQGHLPFASVEIELLTFNTP